MARHTIRNQIETAAFDILKQHPNGLQYSELRRRISEENPNFKINTIYGTLVGLGTRFPNRHAVYFALRNTEIKKRVS